MFLLCGGDIMNMHNACRAPARGNYYGMTEQNGNGTALLRKLQTLGFALYDTALYLDSHPHDLAALEYYKKTLAMYEDAKKIYESTAGPLTVYSGFSDTGWKLHSLPEPWKYEAN